MIRFIHVADIHFGMENYGRIDPKTGIHTRLLDFYQALTSCIDSAIEHNVDFVLFAGDAYKTSHPSPTQQRLLLECFLRLFKAGIPLIIVVGNHDNPLSFGKSHALELYDQIPLNGFHVISKPTVITINTKNGPVALAGVPWPSRTTLALQNSHAYSNATDLANYISSVVATIIEQLAKTIDPDTPAVLAAHLTMSTGIFSGSEKRAIYGTDPILLPSQVAIKPFDYVALGHLHRYQELNPGGHPPVVYSGSIERIDFGERKEEKGFCLVTIHDKQKTTYEFIKTPIRPFIQIETHLEGLQSQTDQIIAALRAQSLEDAVVKIIYHVPPGKQDYVDITTVQQQCAVAHYLAGIIPLRVPEPHNRRLPLRVDMTFEEVLDTYLRTKPHLKKKRTELTEKIMALQAELFQEENS